MKIIEVTPISGHSVVTDSKDFPRHTRWGPNSWTVRMGESEETVYDYDCDELEAAFQAFMAEKHTHSDREFYCHVTDFNPETDPPTKRPCQAAVGVRLKEYPNGYYCLHHAAMLMAYNGKRAEDFVHVPRYYVKMFAPGCWHVIDTAGHPLYDDAQHGNDRPIIFHDEDEALACAERCNQDDDGTAE